MQRVREARIQGWALAENIPLLGGATVCVLLPIAAQRRPVVLGLGGTLERIMPQKEKLLALMKELSGQLLVTPQGHPGDSMA